MAAKRILYLHESALSHAEYTQYVESFDELVEGDRSQFATVSVREARGWLKGRYAANNTVDAATIDKILRLFYPQLAPSDSLTAGQFYAVLRLITHVQNGKEVDESLVFSQPENSHRRSPPVPPRSLGYAQSQERRSPPPPLPPKRSAPTTPKTTQTDLVSVSSAASEPPPTPGFHSKNPFANRGSSAPNSAKPTINGSTLSSDEGSNPDTTARVSTSPTSSNPFINRGKGGSGTRPAVPAPVSSPPLSTAGSTPVPPLPPRKSSLLPPPRHASQQAGATSATSTNSGGPPPKPPKPPMPFPVSPLIKQGLLAAKGAQLKSEMSLDKLRTWEVIKTGGGGTTPSKERSISPSSNTPGRIRSTTMRRTVKSEDGRFGNSTGEECEDDDRASTSTSTNTNTSGREGGGDASQGGVINHSSGTRLGRSKSLHQPAGIDLPVPPPRRRRPESVQLSSPDKEIFAHPHLIATAPLSGGGAGGFPTFGRRGSHSHNHGIESLHKAVANMRPGFESARARVEGKLIPGGYGRWREERLVDDEEEINGYAPPPPPPPPSSANANANFGGRGRSGNRRVYGSDAEEESVEEGWKPLRG